MAKNKFELHEERLATTDEHGHRVYIYPEDVKGIWRHRRTIFYWFLIFIFLVVPWITWNDQQIILLNLPMREFTFFGETFYAHDAPLVLMILLGFVFTMAFVTSLWGRVWCGWTCPQTVFIDAIYRKIEMLVEGRARQREKLDLSPMSFSKFSKKAIKWSLYLLVSLHISHSVLGYFVGARKLFWITMSPPDEHMTLFLIMWGLTALFLFDFGWFREQFCIIACPYGRIQSVVMDENSLVVAYDPNRGEPRKSPEIEAGKQGDCVNCYACVRACPTGIDIRRGTQLECIACTNCIDACDDIMEKVHKPKGLIRYERESVLEGTKVNKFGLRPKIYLATMIIVASAFVITVNISKGIKTHLIRGKVPFTKRDLADGSTQVMNQYKMTLDYKRTDLPKVKISVDPTFAGKLEVVTPLNPYTVKEGHQKLNLFFKFDKSVLVRGTQRVRLIITDIKTKKVVSSKEVVLVGPIK